MHLARLVNVLTACVTPTEHIMLITLYVMHVRAAGCTRAAMQILLKML